MAKNAKQGGNSRKKGRNKVACQRYKNMMTRERNKARRLVKHLNRFPADLIGAAALRALPTQFAKVART